MHPQSISKKQQNTVYCFGNNPNSDPATTRKHTLALDLLSIYTCKKTICRRTGLAE